MIFPRVCIVLGLVTMSRAQLDVKQLFQVDVDTNDDGGCRYVGQARLNRLLRDCIDLANAVIAAVDDVFDDESSRQGPAQRLLHAYFKSIEGSDLDIVQSIY